MSSPSFCRGKKLSPSPEGSVRPTSGRPVHNIEVDTTHAYYVATTTGTWTLTHNGCTWDESAARWRDTET